MDEKFRLIRGPRIINQLEEEAPYADLEKNTMDFEPPTKKRQFAVQPVQIQRLTLVPFANSGDLEARADITSSGKQYQSIMMFTDIEYQEEDTPDNVTFTGSDNQEHHVIPVSLRSNNVKVRCTCLDFRWRFAMQNQEQGTLYGPGPGLYTKKTNRPPNNPRNVPGLCKHLLKLAIELKQDGVVTV